MEDNLWYDENIYRIKYKLRVSILKRIDGSYKATLYTGGYNNSMTINNSYELEAAIRDSQLERLMKV
jgi:hypothetical protein